MQIRSSVAKVLPVLRKQIHDLGYDVIRECLVKGKTRSMSGKDRRQAIQILDGEYRPINKENNDG